MDYDQNQPFYTRMSRQVRNFKCREIFTWQLLKTLLMGQGLSVLVCGTAITSQYLATDHHLDIPVLQITINFFLLFITYTTRLFFRSGDGNILQILKEKWWKYMLLGLVDVEANYTIVKAYQYTTLTSIQLLDCFIIPVLMILSWYFLKARYKIIHYVAVCVCLAGVGAMVGADLLAGRDQGSTNNILLGDGLVLLCAVLYAVSNLCQEYVVKNQSKEEFLGMLGLFGTLISGIQLGILEHVQLATIQWTWQIALLLSGFNLSLYCLYSCMPVVMKLTSAAAVNLSLLTSDLFSLFLGLYLFHYSFSGLYIMSLVAIMVGFITFNAVPILYLAPEPMCVEQGHDNQAHVFDEEAPGCCTADTSEDQEKEKDKTDSSWRKCPSDNRTCIVISSTEM
ncbi:solute carrier family 35 member F2 [Hoplias malabaricus]|uniref:solute carrier family 35 member F2 n=1 Tax=Hoplias malabaricus TaxID=27720 RepID=UPI0034629FF2